MSDSIGELTFGTNPFRLLRTSGETTVQPGEAAAASKTQNNAPFSPVISPLSPDRLFSYDSIEGYIRSNTGDYTGSRSLTNYYDDGRAVLARRSQFAEVVVNVSLRDVNTRFQHKGGDIYLTKVYMYLQTALKNAGIKFEIYRDGSSFIVRIIDNANEARIKNVMDRVSRTLSQVREMEILSGKAPMGFKSGITHNLTSYIVDNTSGGMRVEDLRNTSRYFISSANGGEGLLEIFGVDAESVKRLDASGRVVGGIKPFEARKTWARWWEFLKEGIRKENPNLKLTDAQLEEAAARIFLEPDSGLMNRRAYQLIATEMHKTQGPNRVVSHGFFDGNKFGSIAKEYGVLGDQILDLIMSKMGPDAEATFAKRGIILFRSGPRSEELLMLGEVNKATLEEALSEFVTRTGEGFKIKLAAGELRSLKDPHGYLRRYLKNQMNIDLDKIPADQALEINVAKLRRGDAGLRGLTFTGTHVEVEKIEGVKASTVVEATSGDLDRRTTASKAENPERRHMFRESERVTQENIRKLVAQFKEGNEVRISVAGRELMGKVSKVIAGHAGAFAFITVVGLAEPVIINLAALSDSQQSGKTTIKRVAIAGGVTAISIGIFEVGTRAALYGLTKAGAAEVAAFIGTKAIPVIGWVLTAVSVFDIAEKLYVSGSMGKVTMMDLMGVDVKNPDGSVRKANNKGVKAFDLDDPKGTRPVQVGEVEAALTLFKLGFFNDKNAFAATGVGSTHKAAISSLEMGPATMTLNMTPTGTAITNPEDIESIALTTSYGREHPDIMIYEAIRAVSSGKMESIAFARLMMEPRYRAIFRSLLKEAVVKFRSEQGYSAGDGNNGHLTDFDCAAILSFSQPV